MIGIDEAGRGSLIGPVFACALYFPSQLQLEFTLNDSKLLTHKKRLEIYHKLKAQPEVKFAVGTANIEEISELNILQATMLAMERAFYSLTSTNPNIKIETKIDGNKKPTSMPFAECVIGGDKLIPQISAASIIAKVERDEEMLKIHSQIPQYNIAKHKGYGTKAHFEAIKQHGLSPFHRKGWNYSLAE